MYFRCACSHLYHVQILVALEACRHFKQFIFFFFFKLETQLNVEGAVKQTELHLCSFISFFFFVLEENYIGDF